MQVEQVQVGETLAVAPVRSVLDRLAWLGNQLLVPFGLLAVALAVTMVVVLHLLPGWLRVPCASI